MPSTTRPNWIKERAECKLSVVFEQLCNEIESDVEEMEKVAPKINYRGSCKVNRQSTVLTVEGTDEFDEFSFRVQAMVNKSEKFLTVTVERSRQTTRSYKVQPRWNPKQERCTLLCDGTPREYWEVCKLVFEPLFFEDEE